MKTLVIVLFSFLLSSLSTEAQKISNKPAPFQGTKNFCSFSGKSKYAVTIKGSMATLVYLYKEYKTTVHGTFKNGKLFTNDQYEKDSKTGGKYYLVTTSMVRVLNVENGDYEEYDVCK
jgi:hypothetical protein